MGTYPQTDRQGMLEDVGAAPKTVCGEESKTDNIHRNCEMGEDTSVYYRTRNYGTVGFAVSSIITKTAGIESLLFFCFGRFYEKRDFRYITVSMIFAILTKTGVLGGNAPLTKMCCWKTEFVKSAIEYCTFD